MKQTIHGPDANSILNNIQHFEFIFCLKLMKLVFELTNSLSLHFQKKIMLTSLLFNY
jgi:hypothetical protein